MKNLEDTISKAMERLPEMVDAVVMIMGRVDRMLATLEKEDVSHKAVAALVHADEVLATIKQTVANIDNAHLGDKSAATIADIQVAIAKMNKVLDRVDGDKGLVASLQGATDAFGEMGRNGRATQRDLDNTLRDVSEAAESIRKLADSLERDPDMLLKGKAKGKASNK